MVPPFIRQMHHIALLGTPSEARSQPYTLHGALALGSDMEPYDLQGDVSGGQVAEIKSALIALAKHGASGVMKPQDRILETRWQDITSGDAWDSGTNDEFLLAMSRHHGLVDNPPYVQPGPGGTLQPTVMGLEVLAGALHEVLGQSMPLYETWRATCSFPHCIGSAPPPAYASRPPKDSPITPTEIVDPLDVPPHDAPAEVLTAIASIEPQLMAAQQAALSAGTEADRTAAAQQIQNLRVQRIALVQTARTRSPSECAKNAACNWDAALQKCFCTGAVQPPPKPPGPVVVPPPVPKQSNTALWVIGAGILLGGAYLYSQRGRR